MTLEKRLAEVAWLLAAGFLHLRAGNAASGDRGAPPEAAQDEAGAGP